jgi:hypothetical protein
MCDVLEVALTGYYAWREEAAAFPNRRLGLLYW